MVTHKDFDCFLKQFSVQVVIPEIAEKIGLEDAIILQQLYYWINKCGKLLDGNIWIYNTYEEWRKQFKYLSISTIKRIFKRLENRGLISSKKINVHKSDHTKWYSINYEKLVDLLKECLPEKKFALDQSELSSSQIDTIYSITDNNLQDNIFLSSKGSRVEKAIKSDRKNFNNKKENEKKAFSCKSIVENKINSLDGKTLTVSANLSDKDKEICQQMLTVWNDIFIKKEDKTSYTEGRAVKLIQLWSNLFDRDLKKWEDFCLKVNSSKFLMGEKKKDFKAYFDWLVNEVTAKKVLSGQLGVGDRTPDIVRIKHEKLLEDIQNKQALERKEKVYQQELETLTKRLKQQALAELSNSAEGSEEIIKAKFEVFMLEENELDEFLGNFKEEFKLKGWRTYGVDLMLEHFKLTHILGKTEEYYKEAAKKTIEQLFTN